MNKHSYLSTRLVDLNNIKMYTADKQYKNRRHIGLNGITESRVRDPLGARTS